MQPRLELLPEKRLVGKHLTMSLANNLTHELWSSFMRVRREIRNPVGTDLYSMQVYDPALDFALFTPATVFEKWAAVEVTDFDAVPDGMESFILPSGAYAVFLHTGSPADFERTFHAIFAVWLPASAYVPDNSRPHFELLGDRYSNTSPDSEEEVWVPVKPKTAI